MAGTGRPSRSGRSRSVPWRGASGEADTPSGSAPLCEPSMSRTVQCTNPFASGSSTSSTSAAVPSGTPSQARSGETSSPSHVNRRGIEPPAAKDVEDRVNGAMVASGVSGWGRDWSAYQGSGCRSSRRRSWAMDPAIDDAGIDAVEGPAALHPAADMATTVSSSGEGGRRGPVHAGILLPARRSVSRSMIRQPSSAGRQPAGAGRSSGRPYALHRCATWNPSPSYSWSAPVGFDPSTPSHASSMP